MRKIFGSILFAVLFITPLLTPLPVMAQAAELRPSYMAIDSNRIVQNYALRFGLYNNFEFRGDSIAMPEGWTVEVKRGEVLVQRSLGSELVRDEFGWYSLRAASFDGTYNIKVLNQNNSMVLMNSFIVDSTKPFISVQPRTLTAGQEAQIRIYNTEGVLSSLEELGMSFEIFYFNNGTKVLSTTETGQPASNGLIARRASGEYRVAASAFSAAVSGNPNEYYIGLNRRDARNVLIGVDEGIFKVAQPLAGAPNGGNANPQPETQPEPDQPLPPVLEPESGESTGGRDLDEIGEPEPESMAQKLARPSLPDFRFSVPNITLNVCSDLTGHWGKELLEKLLANYDYPFVRRNNKTLCRPNEPVLRKVMISWILFLHHPEEAREARSLVIGDRDNPFIDLKDNDPFAKYVIKAYRLGLVSGKSGCARAQFFIGCRLGADEPVNRAELVTMLASPYFKNSEAELIDIKKKFPIFNPTTRFKDVTSDKVWYYGYLYFAHANEMIAGAAVGNNRFEAQLSRAVSFAEAAAILEKARGLAKKYERKY